MSGVVHSIIVEDESSSQAALQTMLAQCCPDVNIDGVAGDVREAVEMIDTIKPQLIFLDIALPDGDGFSVLDKIRHTGYRVVFITAFDSYAIKAFECAALHYLLKPVSSADLKEAVERFYQADNEQWEQYSSRIKALQSSMTGHDQKIMLPTAQGYELITMDDIIFLESSHNYTQVHLDNGQQILVSKPLITFESMLCDSHFVRIHNQHIVNLKYVKKYIRGSGGSVQLSNNDELNISKGRKAEFLDKLSAFARHL